MSMMPKQPSDAEVEAVRTWHRLREELDEAASSLFPGDRTATREDYSAFRAVTKELLAPTNDLAKIAVAYGVELSLLKLAAALRELPQPLCWPCEDAASKVLDLVSDCDLAVKQVELRKAFGTGGPGTEQGEPADPLGDPIVFTPVEKAIVLLLRDGQNPRSVRDYASEVGVAHTTLGRNARWRLALATSQEGQMKDISELPSGMKDAEGNLEAWKNEVCENCRRNKSDRPVMVGDEMMRLCDDCAEIHERTNPRTT